MVAIIRSSAARVAIPREGSDAAPPRRSVAGMAVDRGRGSDAALGDLVRYWRRVRGDEPARPGGRGATTPRYMSFVETGRSQPSREMVLRLAVALDVPLRERNGLLVAAGFAPIYPEHDIDDPAHRAGA